MLNDERGKDPARELNDETEWEEEAEEVTTTRPASVVYSVRFAPEELAEIRRVARQLGTTPSELIRTATFEKIYQLAAPNIYTSAVRLIQWYTKNLSSNAVDTGGQQAETAIQTARIELAETA